MLNKLSIQAAYLKALEILNADAAEVVVGGGGACVLLGVREVTEDLDLDVPLHVYRHFAEAGYPVTHYSGNYDTIEVYHRITIHHRATPSTVICTSGVWHYSAENVLEFKRGLNRMKDAADIAALQMLL